MGPERALQTRVEAAWERQAVRQVLERLADVVVRQTPYRRALVCSYKRPILPGSDEVSPIIESTSRGLTPDEQRELARQGNGAREVSGRRFCDRLRIGRSYYFHATDAAIAAVPRIPGRRQFCRPEGWASGDLLIVPLEAEGRLIGEITVDDPRDGARPTCHSLAGLEEIASIGALALRGAECLQRMCAERQLFCFLAENGPAGVAIIQANRFRYVNERLVTLVGYSEKELQTMDPWWQIIHPEDRPAGMAEGGRLLGRTRTLRVVHRDGSPHWLAVEGRPMPFEEGEATLLSLLDAHEQVESERALRDKAIRDPLTGLFNRQYFGEAIQAELERSKRYRRPLTLMMGDLAGFKRVNDELGHQRGDRVLKEVAQVLQGELRGSDWIVRYGGDEFLIVLPETGTGLDRLARRLEAAVRGWAGGTAERFPVEVDLGWATWTPETNLTLAQLLETADAQMYKVKAARHESNPAPARV